MEIRSLGRISYEDAWKLQQEILEDRSEGKIPDTLLILEHPPVFTLGRKLSNSKEKEIHGITVFEIERGGEATYHGPGQIVIYPIFQLGTRFGPKAFLRLMENAIIDILKEFEISAYWIEGKTGVWLQKNKKERKIASLGIAVRKNISYHGLALNVNNDLEPFHWIQPCGFSPDIMINMKELLGKEMPQEEIAFKLAKKIEMFFKTQNL